jgi:hypothetical protein
MGNKYNEFYESLQAQVNDGSLSIESAIVLNDIYYEKFVLESDEFASDEANSEQDEVKVSLESAMNAIDEILTEKETAATNADTTEEPVSESENPAPIEKREFVVSEEKNETSESVNNVTEGAEEITKENVDEMRLRVYEAATAGLITEEEKIAFLSKLVYE